MIGGKRKPPIPILEAMAAWGEAYRAGRTADIVRAA